VGDEGRITSQHPSAGQGQREGDQQQPRARHGPEEQPPRHGRKIIPILDLGVLETSGSSVVPRTRPAQLPDAAQGDVSCLNPFEADPPVDCCSTEALEQQFGPRLAAAELRRYRRRGPGRSARLLLLGLRAHLPPQATLLDVGGGIGALHHELLDYGVARAWEVEPSAAFLLAAEEETRRRGHAGRVEFIHADIRQAAATVPDADIVTLDRVVCCDPDYEQVLQLSLGKARQLFAYSYPRHWLGVRAVVGLQNTLRRLRRTNFRVFVHPPDRMESIIRAHGFSSAFRARTLVWQVGVYTRVATP
jgi:magnesium-protoporphyrin O-methyltransferase